MQARDAHAQVAVLGVLESSLPNHAEERFLIREFTDRFDEVLIAVAVICDDLTHARNDVEGIKNFNEMEFKYSKEHSTEKEFVFLK